MTAEQWDQLSSELAFDDPHFRVRRDTLRLPSGRVVDDYLVGILADYVVVVAVTASDHVVLVRQWRQGVRRFTLELPGGVVDPSEGISEAGARELREETGFVAPSLERLLSLDVDTSKAANQGHVLLALGAERVDEPERHEMESPELVLVAISDVPSLIERGEICASSSVAGLLFALRRLGKPL